MTLSELARLAGVSVSTASKAFSGAEDISEETRAHVLGIARENGCYGKFYRGRHEKHIIAIICPELSSAYYNHHVEILQERLERIGALVLVSADHFGYARQAELIEYYASYLHVDALIIFGLRVPLKRGFDVPAVSIGCTVENSVCDNIEINLEAPIDEAIGCLKEQGHRHIAFIGETLTQTKLTHFKKGMARQLLSVAPEHVIVSTARFESAGEEGMKKLLTSGRPFSAVICAYDYIALGAIRALSEQGRQVPEDCSVIGMDNISVSGYLSRSLTTIDTHTQEVCEIVCELMEKKLRHPHFRVNQKISIAGTLVRRDSVGPASQEEA